MTRFLPFRMLMLAALCALLGACAPRAATPEGAGIPPDTKVVNKYVDVDGRTGIRGRVVTKEGGEPVPGAYVNIYPETFSNLLGPSQFISHPTAEDGSYTLEMPPGVYYVVARKRTSGQPTGPLSPGDFYSEHQRILTTVVSGKMAVVDIPVAVMKAPMFFKKSVVDMATDTGIRGTLVDRQGRPVPGAFATAYVNSDVRRVPDFVSTLTDPDGQFTLYLPEGGAYYLAARIHAWDMPRPGEPYGRVGGETPDPVKVEKGSFVEGIRIVMEPFTGEYKPGKGRQTF